MTEWIVTKSLLPSKITAPEPGHFFERPELLRNVAELSSTFRKVWVSSPGGAGKTTLVRAFLAADPRPLVWYHVDGEDEDPANLFFYLSGTVPDWETNSRPLPKLTPEHLPNFPVFCHTFFRAYFGWFSQGCVLVFDDFQEGPGESFFGPVLTAAMAELPLNSALFVLSREEPYASLARERINRNLAHLGWEDLRLTEEETRRFLSWSLDKEPSIQDMERACSLSQGWFAGLLLFVKNPATASLPQQFSPNRTELLFDYFAGEIFARLPEDTRRFLLTCAFLPTIDSRTAEILTARADAGELLRALARGNHFTFRTSAASDVYRFHPLFRQFLQARAVAELDRDLLTETRIRAAHLLLSNGQNEAGAELLIAARAWTDLIGLVTSQAEVLLRQGRMRTLLGWLKELPEKLRHEDPWLCYWLGCCLSKEDPDKARVELVRAFALFDSSGEAAGSMLTWSMMIYAIVVGGYEHDELDAWIGQFYKIRERHPDYPSPEIEALMLQAVCQALTWRRPSHADLPGLMERLGQLVTASSNRGFRVLAGSDLLLYHDFVGDLASGRALADLLNPDLQADEISAVQKLVWLGTRALSEMLSLDRSACLDTIDAGRAVITESGVHVLEMRMYAPGIALGLSTGDLPLARQLLGELKAAPFEAFVDQALYLCMTADLSRQEGGFRKAVALAELAVGKAEAAGSTIVLSLAYSVLVVALYSAGQQKHARAALARGIEVAAGMNYFCYLFNGLRALFALEDRKPDLAHAWLREAFGMAARQGYLNAFPWRNDVMTRLCREALDARIEVDYVRHLTACRDLDLGQGDTAPLTPKEIEILTWVAVGKTNGQIARIQGVSERTVKFHVGNILQKLGAETRTHAVSIATELGLVARE